MRSAADVLALSESVPLQQPGRTFDDCKEQQFQMWYWHAIARDGPGVEAGQM